MHALATILGAVLALAPMAPAEARNFDNPIFAGLAPEIDAKPFDAPQALSPPVEPDLPPASPAPSGFSIPRHIVMCESGGDYTAQNPRSSAGGAYQMIQSTANDAAWAIGRPELVGVRAARWPPGAQDRAAAWLWNGGEGRSHWRACL